jgi:hypothetical protein
MITKFIERFMNNKPTLEAVFSEKHPDNYLDIVKAVVTVLEEPDPTRIHELDDGDYQGTLVYVIAEKRYQPSKYWYVMVDYGSCSGCDTLQAIQDSNYGKPTDEQVVDYMTLALHIVQGMKEMT